MGNISKNFSFDEFEYSARAIAEGIENKIPSAQVGAAIKNLTVTVLQPLRDDLEASVIVESGYRCKELNELVGGVESSHHRKGEAADIRSPFFEPLHIARRIVALQLPFDQLILYPTFVHVSHKLRGKQRGQILYNRRWTGEKI
jgi:hypothetical protein